MSNFKGHLNKLLALATRHKYIIERTVERSQGSRSVYEYGPLGTEMRKNLRQLWWRDVVTYKERVHGIELSMFESDNGLILSDFEEDSMKDGDCKPAAMFLDNFEKLINEVAFYALENKCKDMTKAKYDIREMLSRNTVQLKTKNHIYREGLGMLYNTFLTDSQLALPQGYAWQGKYVAMDNDESNFLRNIEEELLCLKFYFEARTAKYWLNYWRRQRLGWWRKFANVPSNFSSFDIQQKSQVRLVTENQYSFPWGKDQIESINYWPSSNPFGGHPKMASTLKTGFHPHILQSSANLDKGFIALLVDAFEEKERAGDDEQVCTRSVLYLHPSLAPIKVAVLSQNKERNELLEVGHQLASELRQAGICTSSGFDSISEQMYAYYDEIGTPYCITVLDSTLTNGVVTLRSRDTTLQEFLHISDVLKTLQSHLKTSYYRIP